MNVSLTPELEAFVHQRVNSGRYSSASEVVREGLRLLEASELSRQQREDLLREEIMEGVEDMKAGRYTTLRTKEDFDRFAEEVKREGRRLSEEWKNKA